MPPKEAEGEMKNTFSLFTITFYFILSPPVRQNGSSFFRCKKSFAARPHQPERYHPYPFLNNWAALMRRCRSLKGGSPSSERRLASRRPSCSEIFDLCGMDDLFRVAYMKPVG